MCQWQIKGEQGLPLQAAVLQVKWWPASRTVHPAQGIWGLLKTLPASATPASSFSLQSQAAVMGSKLFIIPAFIIDHDNTDDNVTH